jgi:asparaginyl-tRNA synthetase
VKPFPRIRYTEAIEMLQKAGQPAKFGDDFGGEDETIISQAFDRPVMVNRYPAEIKAFYMKRDPDDSRLALGVDVLAPEGYGEVVGGGQRETSLAALESAIDHHNLPRGPFEWYLRPARRLRPRPRAHRLLDLRPQARPRDHPLPPHARAPDPVDLEPRPS